jgi:putative endonuclease
MKPFFVYMLRCSDGSYYCGHTDNIEIRMQQHSNGTSGYTCTRRPLALIWQGEFESREGALAFEQRIKGWSRAKKEALMAGDWERIRELAKSRGGPSTSSGRTGVGSSGRTGMGSSGRTGMGSSGRTGVGGSGRPGVGSSEQAGMGSGRNGSSPFGLSLSKPLQLGATSDD